MNRPASPSPAPGESLPEAPGGAERSRFESIGTWLPARVETTADLLARLNCPPFDLTAITGIQRRHVCTDGEAPEDSLFLAEQAARDCLARSRYRAEDLDVVIWCALSRTQGPHHVHMEPSFAQIVKRRIGAGNATHFDVSNACAGMLTGVWLLDRMIRAGVVRTGMVVSGELISPIAESAVEAVTGPRDPQFASLTVGDAGAAVLLDRAVDDADVIHAIELLTCAEFAELCIGMPNAQRSGMAMYTNNHELHRPARALLWPQFQADRLAARGSSFSAEGYDHLVHHQLGTMAIKVMSRFGETVFGASMPESLTCVETCGNTASTSHFVVLHKHLQEGRVRPGAKVLLVPAASGIVTGYLSATISSLQG